MTIKTGAIAYRPMTEQDLPAAHALSQAVRWPHRLEDWQFVQRLGSGFVAEADGVPVGTALCWLQGARHGSLGMIIVSEAHQGKGIGRKLMHLVLDALGERCTLLQATAAGQPLYESLGFQATGTLYQHQGTLAAVAPVALAAGEIVRPARAGDLSGMIALAKRATGMARDELLTQLAGVAEAAVLERGGELAGFSVMRRFGRGHAIGPLVAPDGERAKALVAYWAGAYGGAFVRVDVTAASGLSDWLAQVGLVQVDSAVTMARNGVPVQDPHMHQFAIASQALC